MLELLFNGTLDDSLPSARVPDPMLVAFVASALQLAVESDRVAHAGRLFDITPAELIAVRKLLAAPVSGITELLLPATTVNAPLAVAAGATVVDPLEDPNSVIKEPGGPLVTVIDAILTAFVPSHLNN